MMARSPGRSPRRWLLTVPIVAGTCLLLVAVALVLILLVRGSLPGADDEPTPTVLATVTEPAPTTTPPGVALTPVPRPECATVISSGDTEVAVPPPISVTVGGEDLSVLAFVPAVQGWTYPADYSGAAAWVCGTVVNYVLELDPTPQNEQLLGSLRPGDEISLRLSNGTRLIFRFADLREVAAGDQSVLDQFRPRSTLILAKDGDEWQVATAEYVAEAEPARLPSGTPVGLNEAARVGDVQVTVTKWHIKRDQPNQQPETMFYLVEFSIENLSTGPLNASAFSMQLQDSAGNWYLLSPTASAAGENGSPGGEIPAGAVIQGTAGYVVPDMLRGPNLIWTFNPKPGADAQASVSIPYQAEPQSSTLEQIEVSVTDAFLSADGATVVIEGELMNAGDTPFSVALNNVSLTSSAGLSELRMAAPPLPWSIAPGQTQIVELQYVKPDAPAALLTLLGYTFEIQGLQ